MGEPMGPVMGCLDRLGTWMIVVAMAIGAGWLVGLGLRHTLSDPTPGPGLILVGLGGFLAWLAYRVYERDRYGEGDQ